MFVNIVTEPNKQDLVKQKIEASGYTVTLVADHNVIIVRIDGFVRKNKTIEKQFKEIDGVLQARVIERYLNRKSVELEEALRSNKCRFIFDVDGTLTQLGGVGTIHPKIEEIFSNIVGKGIRIYIATGRPMDDLNTIIQNYPVEKNSICENGGIILGFPPDNYFEFGKKTEPNKVLDYLQSKYGIKEDMIQGERFTEVIFLQNDVSMDQINEAISKTKAKVSINPSEKSYHISKHGVNKGTAIIELAKRKHWGTSMIIAVGDTDMDIPMFEKSTYSFAMGNATDAAKAAANQILNGAYEKGIEEIYELIKKVS